MEPFFQESTVLFTLYSIIIHKILAFYVFWLTATWISEHRVCGPLNARLSRFDYTLYLTEFNTVHYSSVFTNLVHYHANLYYDVYFLASEREILLLIQVYRIFKILIFFEFFINN